MPKLEFGGVVIALGHVGFNGARFQQFFLIVIHHLVPHSLYQWLRVDWQHANKAKGLR